MTYRLYISGPMTGLPEFNFRAFDAMADFLRRTGFEPISPADHDRVALMEAFRSGKTPYTDVTFVPGYAEGDVEAYSKHAGAVHDLLVWDIAEIVHADGIVLLPGWENSTGSAHERYVAEATNKRIFIAEFFADGSINMIEDDEQVRLTKRPKYAQRNADTIHAELGKAWLDALPEQGASSAYTMIDPYNPPLKLSGNEPGKWVDPYGPPRVRPDELGKAWLNAGPTESFQYQSARRPVTFDIEPDKLVEVRSLSPGENTALDMGEVRVVDPKTGGAKGMKPQRMDLLPYDVLLDVSEHYARGAEKYEARNWEKGYAYSLSFAALLRHLFAWWNGEDDDSEFGASHLRGVLFHAMSLRAFELRNAGTDDRPSIWRAVA